jgi:hypothetical protein
MHAIEARAILAKIDYRGWQSLLGHYTNGAFWLQWSWREHGVERRSQRWYVSNQVSASDLVDIARQAIEQAELKQVRENFRYRDQAIYAECDVDQLSDLHARLRAMEKELEGEEKENA